jgi:hypothetical protein
MVSCASELRYGLGVALDLRIGIGSCLRYGINIVVVVVLTLIEISTTVLSVVSSFGGGVLPHHSL